MANSKNLSKVATDSGSPATRALPEYLRQYIVEQNYASYTAQDHAVWRFIMRQNRDFFKAHALPIYLEGLERTGLPTDTIPRVDAMDRCLARLGWGAVPVRGFIPPAVFLDFQARGVLPIACDMRTLDHLAYTPAPDIVHEAAGHAPIIADPSYSRYLHRYAQMARKALRAQYDIDVYEAVRLLSDIKENPDTPTEKIADAERALKQLVAQAPEASELAKVTRMNWWTVEYGLMGDLKQPKIYGAGLLSSIGESQSCLSSRVKKIPLSVDCTHFGYDITEPQPQLFVARDMEHLLEVLEDFEKTLSFRLGGVYALEAGRAAASTCTVELDSGLQISGKISRFLHEGKRVDFFHMEGPVQICREGVELPNHGIERHAHGFSSPLGRWAHDPDCDPARLTRDDLKRWNAFEDTQLDFRLQSGFRIQGTLKKIHAFQSKVDMLTWENCTVSRGSEVFFQPAWGEFDLVLGAEVISVFGGAADPGRYGDNNLGKISSSPARTTPFSAAERTRFKMFERVRNLRETESPAADAVRGLVTEVLSLEEAPWLLLLEAFELSCRLHQNPASKPDSGLRSQLDRAGKHSPEHRDLIEKGIRIASAS